MITDTESLNVDGKAVRRNKIGITQEKIYGASWLCQDSYYKLMFNEPTFISFAEEDELVLVMSENKKGIYSGIFFYSGLGKFIKELSISSIPKEDGIDGDITTLLALVNREKHLYGFIYTIGKRDFSIDFDADKLEFGSDLKRTRL
ncbi:hypothetical protein [Marinomonas posidonica]|uniref:Uncharacterized protein n=1 Tax=Marinomonas posidonica (strain CECT 7376 / NCIMB 14433 / IVIA-Po-181) TaxID=491952 RepID=F6CSV6_MARPP|nr:hypothetical protein [Marinomonas posidonica]AEF53946.1 hypothetical protein Mar181_0895 [Marinomonas posidonica IVIA-Po-181]